VLAFAYDGSLNGDWVAHYAVRFAANRPARTLRLIHVRDGAVEAHVEARIARIAEECAVVGVTLEVELAERGGHGVAERILELAPPRATIVAGTRARARGSAFLAGTVSARLLEAGRAPVVAIRVVHPGVLGQPGRVLLPLAGRPMPAVAALPILRLLGADLQHLELLFVREVSSLRMRLVERDDVDTLIAEGRAFLAPLEDELRQALSPMRFELDASVVVSDDTAKEIVLTAARHRARLVCLRASERTFSRRIVHGDLVERVLRDSASDVAVYGGGE
jgi:nucleotide-binding universal stress UspA family protein